jgi:hypothetical protein
MATQGVLGLAPQTWPGAQQVLKQQLCEPGQHELPQHWSLAALQQNPL